MLTTDKYVALNSIENNLFGVLLQCYWSDLDIFDSKFIYLIYIIS